MCIDAKTGKDVYTQKMKNKHYSSPVFANGMIYFTSGKGETMILKEGRKLEIISENKLPGEVFATPAILRNQILLPELTNLEFRMPKYRQLGLVNWQNWPATWEPKLFGYLPVTNAPEFRTTNNMLKL